MPLASVASTRSPVARPPDGAGTRLISTTFTEPEASSRLPQVVLQASTIAIGEVEQPIAAPISVDAHAERRSIDAYFMPMTPPPTTISVCGRYGSSGSRRW